MTTHSARPRRHSHYDSPGVIPLHQGHPIEEGARVVPILGERRLLLPGLVELSAIFNETFDERRLLGHDCSVLALAHLTGRLYSNRMFYRPGTIGIAITSLKRTMVPVGAFDSQQVAPGEVLLITGGKLPPADQPGAIDFYRHHMMIKASLDNQEPDIYVSKNSANSLAVAMPYEAIMYYHQAKNVAVIDTLEARLLPLSRR